KALISHTAAIISNKFSKHRPNTAQQSKQRELATSSVLLATPTAESRENSGDDSSSLYGNSPVDFSRSPPRSIRRSQTSIPVPSSTSRSSSVASSMRSHLSGPNANMSNSGVNQGNNNSDNNSINMDEGDDNNNNNSRVQGQVTVQHQATGAVPSF